MHGESLVLFSYSGGIAIGQQTLARARTHIIYRYSAVRKKKIIIILKKVAKKFGRLKNMLYLCSKK